MCILYICITYTWECYISSTNIMVNIIFNMLYKIPISIFIISIDIDHFILEYIDRSSILITNINDIYIYIYMYMISRY